MQPFFDKMSKTQNLESKYLMDYKFWIKFAVGNSKVNVYLTVWITSFTNDCLWKQSQTKCSKSPAPSTIPKKLLYLLNFELLATLVLRALVKIHKRNHKRHKQNHKHYKQPHMRRHIFLPCTWNYLVILNSYDCFIWFC